MFGSTETGSLAAVAIIGEKAIGEDQAQEFGYPEVGKESIMAGIGDVVIGNRSHSNDNASGIPLAFFIPR
jgi:hypothetical protein